MGGIEGSSHRRTDGRQLDLIAATRHDAHAFADHWMLRDLAGGAIIPLGHWFCRPLRLLLADVHARCNRPLLLTETGAEGGNDPGWLGCVAGEMRAARHAGVPVEGACLHPAMDHPGWNDDRHCRCGLIRADRGWRSRAVDTELRDRPAEEAALLPAARSGKLP